MAEITLTGEEISELENKLRNERGGMPADEAAIIEAVLNRARSAKSEASTSDPGWLFSWTYRF